METYGQRRMEKVESFEELDQNDGGANEERKWDMKLILI